MAINVLLREVTQDDLPVFFEHQLDPESSRMAAFPPRQREEFMKHWRKILDDDSIVRRTILCDGDVVGHVVCFEREGLHEVGYWIGREHWGRGIATRALSDFLAVVKVRPLHAYVARHNTASLRVLEKCGFQAREDVKPMSPHVGGVEEVLLELPEETA
jgi:RimJ/RimL family protein N-acetyltransferase